MPFDVVYTRDCPCGASFVSVDIRLRWCLKCRKSGRNKLRPHQWLLSRSAAIRAHASGSHTLDEWLAVLRAQNWCCYYCDREMTSLTWTRDHVVPLSKGGTDYISNIVAACRSCNAKKGTLTASAFKKKLENNIYRQQQQQAANISVDKTMERYESKIESNLDNLWESASNDVEPLWVDVKYRQLG